MFPEGSFLQHAGGYVRSAFLLLVMCYFAYHAVSGERGMLALLQFSQKISAAQMKLDLVRAERMELEHKVASLRPESLDLDLLDEQSRRMLGYAAEGEIVLPVK